MVFFFDFVVAFAAGVLVIYCKAWSREPHGHDATHQHGVTIPVHAVQLHTVHVFLPKAIMNCASQSSSISASCLFVWFLFASCCREPVCSSTSISVGSSSAAAGNRAAEQQSSSSSRAAAEQQQQQQSSSSRTAEQQQRQSSSKNSSRAAATAAEQRQQRQSSGSSGRTDVTNKQERGHGTGEFA